MVFTQVGKTQYYYEIFGEGPPLILISGYTCQHDYWLPVMEKLAETFQVIILDNRGVGQTTDEDESLTAKLLADDMALLMDNLGLSKPHIIGHSMGGNIAMQLAISHPENCGKIILLATSPKWRAVALRSQLSFHHLYRQQIDPLITLEIVLPWIMGDRFLKDPNKIKPYTEYRAGLSPPLTLETMERQMNVLTTFDIYEELPQIKSKTLVCYGLQDLLVLPEQSRAMAEKIPGAKAVEFDTGHTIQWEDPDKFISEVKEFLL